MSEEDRIEVSWSRRVKNQQQTEPAAEDAFVASNGIKIETDHDGALVGTGEGGYIRVWVGPDGINALREYFQHERDAELGRWRDPETGLLVYQINDDPDTVFVFDETYADHGTWTREQVGPTTTGFGAPIAERYFATHPEPKPAWHDAEPGEVWVVEVCGLQYASLVDEEKDSEGKSVTLFVTYKDWVWEVTDPDITHATKLWPQDQETNND